MTTLYLHGVMGIGSTSLPAPQATLMATIIKGLLSRNLPWGLVLVGVFISVTLELCGIRSLSFAVGLVPADCHDCTDFRRRHWFGRSSSGKPRTSEESEVGAGTLFSSGLIAGGSLAGILYAILFGRNLISEAESVTGPIPFLHEGTSGMIAGALLFLALAVVLARAAQKKIM